ncbi:IniB N-terminal domain-containing protein [Petropleomorpha daqingensis]|uniref:Dentin sialophosphoprotein n=1 Tax=Petropleomorpha daqingensis TaxID=2026353 RepID=A0A853CCJ7_9ACTN|nr:IniB N-terminal domain-containing protein [Petropleomorpha daqingensis]NYJ05484.1 hypothetical protein [Petropleomorpha daqingensis]
MSNITSTLLDFILSLLKDPQQAQAFNEHPEQALHDAGLSDVCGADVQAIMPMLSDYAPAGVSPYHAHSSGYSPSYSKHNQGRDNYQHGPEHDGGYQAIEHIKYVQQNYSYSHTQVLDFSHSVWGDQYNVWAEDSAVAINGGVAAGDDIKDSEVKAVNNTGDGSAVGFGNTVQNSDSFNHIANSGDGATVGVGNTSDYEGAFNHNSGDGAAVGYENTTDDSGNSADNGGNSGEGGTVDNSVHDSNNSADHGGVSGENSSADNSHVDVGPIDVGGVAIAGQNAVAGEDNTNVNDSNGVVAAGDDINHSLDDNFSPSDNFSHNDTDILSHNFNGNEVEQGHGPMGPPEMHMAP